MLERLTKFIALVGGALAGLCPCHGEPIPRNHPNPLRWDPRLMKGRRDAE